MRRALVAFLAGAALVIACTPAQRAGAIVPVTDSACVLIHGFARSGTADTLCATAEDLAPFVADILAEREATEPKGPLLAVAVAELPAPKARRARARRRCVSWAPAASFLDGSILDASAEGHHEAGGGDGSAAR